VQEAVNAVKPSSGLHAVRSCKSVLKKAEWVDVGATTIPEVRGVLKNIQPLMWYYLTKIATRKPRVRGGVVQVRKQRPVDAVSTYNRSASRGLSHRNQSRIAPMLWLR
jgi:hypothetical protein